MENIGIILAGGTGERFGDTTPKQFIILHGRRVLDYSVSTFLKHDNINSVIIVCPKDWIKIIQKEYPNCLVVESGKTRKDSSFNGLKACSKNTKNVFYVD